MRKYSEDLKRRGQLGGVPSGEVGGEDASAVNLRTEDGESRITPEYHFVRSSVRDPLLRTLKRCAGGMLSSGLVHVFH